MQREDIIVENIASEDNLVIRLASRRIRNQQNLYSKVPTAVAELLQYSGLV